MVFIRKTLFAVLMLVQLAVAEEFECISKLSHRWAFDEIKGTVAKNTAPDGMSKVNLPARGINFMVQTPTDVECQNTTQCDEAKGEGCMNGFCSTWNPQGTSAMRFDGTDMVEPLVYRRPQRMTMTMWFRTSPENTREMALATFYDVNNQIALRVSGDASKPEPGQASYAGRLKLYLSSSFNPNLTPRSYNDGKWHFAAVTITPSEAKIYIYDPADLAMDSLQASPKITYTLDPDQTQDTQFFQIGGYSATKPQDYFYFNGDMDDIRLYDTLITDGRILDIARMQDFPCTATPLKLGVQDMVLEAGEVQTLVLDTSEEVVCAPAKDGECQSKRYGVAIQSCNGAFSGLNFNVAGSTSNQASATASYTNFCAATSTFEDASLQTRLCQTVPDNRLSVEFEQPINGALLNQFIIVGADNENKEDTRYVVKVTVADEETYNPTTIAFATVKADTVTCTDNNSTISASWPVPVLSDGQACSDCLYQVYLVPANQMAGVNLESECGLKSVGTPYGPKCTLNELIALQLTDDVLYGEYQVVMYGTSAVHQASGVVSILEGCMMNHSAPTVEANATKTKNTTEVDQACPCNSVLQCESAKYCTDSRCSNEEPPKTNSTPNATVPETVGVELKLDMDWDTYSSKGPAEQEIFKDDFMDDIAEALETNRSRLLFDKIYPGSIINSFEILPATETPPTPAPEPCCTEAVALCEACNAGLSVQNYCVANNNKPSGCSDLKTASQKCNVDEGIVCALNLYCENGVCIPEANRPPTPAPVKPVMDMRTASDLTQELEKQVQDVNSTLHKLQPDLDPTYFKSNLPDEDTTTKAPETTTSSSKSNSTTKANTTNVTTESPNGSLNTEVNHPPVVAPGAPATEDVALIVGVTCGVLLLVAIVGVLLCFVKKCLCFSGRNDKPNKPAGSSMQGGAKGSFNKSASGKLNKTGSQNFKNKSNGAGASSSNANKNNSKKSNIGSASNKPTSSSLSSKPAAASKPAVKSTASSSKPAAANSTQSKFAQAKANPTPPPASDAASDFSGEGDSGISSAEEGNSGWVTASYDWDGQKPGDLKFKTQQIIQIISIETEEGPDWMRGRIKQPDGTLLTGWVPVTYVSNVRETEH